MRSRQQMQMQWFGVNSQMCYRSSVVYIFRRFNFSRFDSISNAQDIVLVLIGTDNGFILAYGVKSAIHRMYIFLIPVIITTNGSCAHSLTFLLSIFLICSTTDLPIFVYVLGEVYILQLMLSFCVRVVKCSLPAVVIAQCYHSGLRRMRSYCLLICR